MKIRSAHKVKILNAIFTLSVLLLVPGVLLLAMPQKSVALVLRTRSTDLKTDKAELEIQAARDAIRNKCWNLDSDELGGAVLNYLSVSAEKHHVQISDFRSEKSKWMAGQKLSPFLVVIDGDFKNLMELVRGLQDPGSRLAISMLQVATSDQGPGQAKATIGLSAFVGGDD